MSEKRGSSSEFSDRSPLPREYNQMRTIGNGTSLEAIERRRFLKEKGYTTWQKNTRKGKKNRRTLCGQGL